MISYNDKLDKIVERYNNRYYRTIEMKHVDVKSCTYIGFGVEINGKYSKLKLMIM